MSRNNRILVEVDAKQQLTRVFTTFLDTVQYRDMLAKAIGLIGGPIDDCEGAIEASEILDWEPGTRELLISYFLKIDPKLKVEDLSLNKMVRDLIQDHSRLMQELGAGK